MASRKKNEQMDLYPVLPLRDVVIPPNTIVPLFVGRQSSIKALELAAKKNKKIFLVAQVDATVEQPIAQDLYRVGSIVHLLQMLKLPDGTLKVLVEGEQRAKAIEYFDNDNYIEALLLPLVEEIDNDEEIHFLRINVLEQFEQHIKINKKIANEILASISTIDDPGRLADTIAAHLSLKIEHKQELLEQLNVRLRLERLLLLLQYENDLLQLDHRIRGRVKKQMERSQREYYLNEQMKAIQRELGDGDNQDYEDLDQKIAQAKMPADVAKVAKSEMAKLRMMSPMSAEASVSRSYVEWLTKLPWNNRSRIQHNLDHASDCLDQEHYGLEKVKERILEYLAVQTRVKHQKGPILCFVGPPGVGKTSLAQSIAKATGRKYVRISLGGVRDEAEIRGHRRTYIGALPGKILQRMAKVGVKNPLFLLDEVDKMSADYRGDPASALLEVLDPEQNHSFNDHYLEVDFDLSEVMFIATANTLNIPEPLVDRMEIIRLSGYTEDEKCKIAKDYLVPKELKNHGIKNKELSFSDNAIRGIIQNYTREAGVRQLDREFAKISRKVVRQLLDKAKGSSLKILNRNLNKFLGVAKYHYHTNDLMHRVGLVTGLAWTESGGDTLTIETVVVPGSGKISSTGKLGEVMKESVQAAVSVVRARANHLGITHHFYKESDIHVHVPEGAVPKDGPSAGAAICTALVSSLLEIPVLSYIAMTGEITLRGEILAIGGLKEKLLAARRSGITKVLIPYKNEPDLQEIHPSVYHGIEIKPVRWIDEVLELALERRPTAATVTNIEKELPSTIISDQQSVERENWHS